MAKRKSGRSTWNTMSGICMAVRSRGEIVICVDCAGYFMDRIRSLLIVIISKGRLLLWKCLGDMADR